MSAESVNSRNMRTRLRHLAKQIIYKVEWHHMEWMAFSTKPCQMNRRTKGNQLMSRKWLRCQLRHDLSPTAFTRQTNVFFKLEKFNYHLMVMWTTCHHLGFGLSHVVQYNSTWRLVDTNSPFTWDGEQLNYAETSSGDRVKNSLTKESINPHLDDLDRLDCLWSL